jgi:hypothetical protein
MHLYIVHAEQRRMGSGAACVRMTAELYFEALALQRLYCEPNAFNAAPNRTLQRAGFKIRGDRSGPAQLSPSSHELGNAEMTSTESQLPPPGHAHSPTLCALLAELPPRVRAAIDTGVFARLSGRDRDTVEHLAELTGAYIVAYDLHIAGRGLPLCAAVGQAYLDRDELAALQTAERRLLPGIALVAYARPAEMRLAEDVLIRVTRGLHAARIPISCRWSRSWCERWPHRDGVSRPRRGRSTGWPCAATLAALSGVRQWSATAWTTTRRPRTRRYRSTHPNGWRRVRSLPREWILLDPRRRRDIGHGCVRRRGLAPGARRS